MLVAMTTHVPCFYRLERRRGEALLLPRDLLRLVDLLRLERRERSFESLRFGDRDRLRGEERLRGDLEGFLFGDSDRFGERDFLGDLDLLADAGRFFGDDSLLWDRDCRVFLLSSTLWSRIAVSRSDLVGELEGLLTTGVLSALGGLILGVSSFGSTSLCGVVEFRCLSFLFFFFFFFSFLCLAGGSGEADFLRYFLSCFGDSLSTSSSFSDSTFSSSFSFFFPFSFLLLMCFIVR